MGVSHLGPTDISLLVLTSLGSDGKQYPAGSREIVGRLASLAPPATHRPTGWAARLAGRRLGRLGRRLRRQAHAPSELHAAAGGTFGLFAAEDERLEGVVAGLADVFVEWHEAGSGGCRSSRMMRRITMRESPFVSPRLLSNLGNSVLAGEGHDPHLGFRCAASGATLLSTPNGVHRCEPHLGLDGCDTAKVRPCRLNPLG